MVRRARPLAWARFGVVLFALLLLAAAVPAALAQGEEYGPMQEEVLIEIDEVGDARVTDTITYDEAWFEEYGVVFDENPFLLSRRYREDSDVGEVENFDVDIDAGESTVTLTFDAPGLVYNMGDKWELYGYGDYNLSEADDDKVVLEVSWEGVNSEYTLWFDMYLDERVVIDLPEGAANADFDQEEGTVSYELPYVPGAGKKGGLLAENKAAFSAAFGAVMALSLLLFIFAMTRKAKEAPAVAAAAPPVSAPPATAPPVAPPPAAVAATPTAPEAAAVAAPPAPAPAATPPKTPPQAAEKEVVPMFCRKCGHPRGAPDERFCRKCGAPHGE